MALVLSTAVRKHTLLQKLEGVASIVELAQGGVEEAGFAAKGV